MDRVILATFEHKGLKAVLLQNDLGFHVQQRGMEFSSEKPDGAVNYYCDLVKRTLGVATHEGARHAWATPSVEARTIEELMKEEIEDLDIFHQASRANHVLRTNGIVTLADLMKLSLTELKAIKGFGYFAQEELTAALAKLGLKLPKYPVQKETKTAA